MTSAEMPLAPVTRLRPVAIAVLIAGAAMVTSPRLLGAAIALAVVATPGSATRAFLSRASFVLLPIVALLFLIWAFLLATRPGQPIGSDGAGGFAFATTTSLRLVLVTYLAFTTLAQIPPTLVPAVLRLWGLRGEGLLLACGALALPAELKHRAQRVVDARFARGLPGHRSILARVVHLPFVVRALVIWTLDTAIGREEEWERRRVIQRVHTTELVRPTFQAQLRDLALLIVGSMMVLWGMTN